VTYSFTSFTTSESWSIDELTNDDNIPVEQVDDEIIGKEDLLSASSDNLSLCISCYC